LCTVSPNRLQSLFPHANGLLHQIGENTLAMCLFHVMVLESLQKGYVGFKKRHDKIDDNDSAEAAAK
jgi:hypothetical protein